MISRESIKVQKFNFEFQRSIPFVKDYKGFSEFIMRLPDFCVEHNFFTLLAINALHIYTKS